MYTYNCTSGLWESSHYTFDPATVTYTPKDTPTYTYNPSNGGYDYPSWVYSAVKNDYVQVVLNTKTPPAGATVVGGPPAANSISNTGAGSSNTINGSGGTGSINNTGPGSDNNVNGNSTNNLNTANNTNASITNGLTATALSGNATVLGNTTAGGATSGDATDIANVTNLLQSTSNALGGNAVTFVANIDGDVNGDILLDPSLISNVQPATGTNTTNINNTSDATINNTIDLTAKTGDASVSNNTSGGDAKSGTAKTIANVINMIDSAVTSGRSFLGVININGNLNGDILLPPDFVNQLLAANVPTVNIITGTGPNSSNTINDNSSSNTNVTNTNNQGINNNVSAKADTGTANVSNNTSAGSATSGNATTSITAFNLTGSSVVGSNDLLVFVNVVGGSWVGLIVNAPAGATAAELGGGIVSNGGNSTTNVDNSSNQQINNNINLASKSGNANVSGNTSGGNAKSGSADAAVNLLNVQHSTLSLSNWFGILFINVFGTWHGSFGVNTSAGDPIASGSGVPSSFVAAPAFSFVPHAAGSSSSSGGGSNSGIFGSAFTPSSTISGTGPNSTNTILAAAKSHKAPALASTPSHVNWILIVSSAGLFLIYIAGERYYAIRQSRGKAV